jgi:general secretion pathway protein M
MTVHKQIIRALSTPLIALAVYIAVTGSFLVITAAAISDIADRRIALAQSSQLLDQLQGRSLRRAQPISSDHPGAPLLEGATVTVAGASLLKRVAGAVNTVGGTIQSSQVDVSNQAKDGLVNLIVSCEVDQLALQKLLYDIESGMPHLFGDQLDVQVPQSTAIDQVGNGRVRIILGISGQWRGAR